MPNMPDENEQREQRYSALDYIPPEIVKLLLAVGPTDWSSTAPQTNEEHVEDYRKMLENTSKLFELPERSVMHFVTQKDAKLALAICGTSPASGQEARILCGLWNKLYEIVLEDTQNKERNNGQEIEGTGVAVADGVQGPEEEVSTEAAGAD